MCIINGENLREDVVAAFLVKNIEKIHSGAEKRSVLVVKQLKWKAGKLFLLSRNILKKRFMLPSSSS